VAREEEFKALLGYGDLHSGNYGALCGKERALARYHQGGFNGTWGGDLENGEFTYSG
jgi:hypothetical protein